MHYKPYFTIGVVPFGSEKMPISHIVTIVKFSTNIFNLDDHDSWETIVVTRPPQVFMNGRHIFVDSSDLVRDLVDEKEEVGQ